MAFEASTERISDDFSDGMKSDDDFFVVESHFEMVHDEPGGSPRFLVNQIEHSHDNLGRAG